MPQVASFSAFQCASAVSVDTVSYRVAAVQHEGYYCLMSRDDARESLRLHKLQKLADAHLSAAVEAGSYIRARRAAQMIELLDQRLNTVAMQRVSPYSNID